MIDRHSFANGLAADSAKYEGFAHRTVEAERATLGRLGLLRKD